ncbi:MAG: hypothetical protein Q9167_006385, partial [Letrouitia subvulpina]
IPPPPETPPSEAPPSSSSLKPFSAAPETMTGTQSGHSKGTASETATSSGGAACSMKSIPPAPETPPSEAPASSTSSLKPFSASPEETTGSGGTNETEKPHNPSATKTGNSDPPESTSKKHKPPPDPTTTKKPEPDPPKTTKKPPPDPPDPTPTVAPVDPPSDSDCEPPPDGDYNDAHSDKVWEAAQWFCSNFGNRVIHADSVSITKVGRDDPFLQMLEDNDSNDDIYDLSITSVPHCDPGPGGYNIAAPVEGSKCEMLIWNSWDKCKTSIIVVVTGTLRKSSKLCLRYKREQNQLSDPLAFEREKERKAFTASFDVIKSRLPSMHPSRTAGWLFAIFCLIVSGFCTPPTYDYVVPNTHLIVRMQQRRLVPINLPTYRILLLLVRQRVSIESSLHGGPTATIAHNFEVAHHGLTFEFNNAGSIARLRPTYQDVLLTLDGLDRGIVRLLFREMNFVLYILNPDRSRGFPLAIGRVFNTDVLVPDNATAVSLDEIALGQ